MKRQKRDTSHRAYLKGYQAGILGRNQTSCPHQEKSTPADEWLRGWREGRHDHWDGFDQRTCILKAANL